MLLAALDHATIHEAASRALGEDRGIGDITSEACIPAERLASGRIVAREACVLAGLPLAEAVLRLAEPGLVLKAHARDGDRLAAGALVLEISGPARGILTGERCALNFLQQLSAVATKTRAFVDAAAGTRAKILDTRKTLPGLRALQKYAVRCGGGVNHRFGLWDAFLIKDNHLALMPDPHDWAGAIAAARRFNPDTKLEVEADTLDQVRLLLPLQPDVILLDNMPLDDMRQAVALAAGRCLLEASGNVTLDRVRAIAETGVDFISAGALTHSIASVDFSLEM